MIQCHAQNATHAVTAEIPSGVTRSEIVKLVHVASMAPALMQHTDQDTHAMTADPSIMSTSVEGDAP